MRVLGPVQQVTAATGAEVRWLRSGYVAETTCENVRTVPEWFSQAAGAATRAARVWRAPPGSYANSGQVSIPDRLGANPLWLVSDIVSNAADVQRDCRLRWQAGPENTKMTETTSWIDDARGMMASSERNALTPPITPHPVTRDRDLPQKTNTEPVTGSRLASFPVNGKAREVEPK